MSTKISLPSLEEIRELEIAKIPGAIQLLAGAIVLLTKRLDAARRAKVYEVKVDG